ncbi:hypothetical protein Tco_1385955 [Tanacetum coccineum]
MSTLTFADTHNMVAFLEKPAESDGFHEIIDFLNANQIRYALTVNPTIYTSCIEQFWATAKAKKVNGERQIQALTDKKKVIITKTSIRSDLHLKDAGGTDCLPTTTSFEELARMRKETEVPQDETHHDDSVPIPSNDPPLSGEDRMQLTRIEDFVATTYKKKVLGFWRRQRMLKAKEDCGLRIGSKVERGKEFKERERPESAKVDEREVSTGVEDSVAPTIPLTTTGEGVIATKIDEITTTSAPTTTIDEITLAQTLIKIKAAKPKVVTTAATTTTTTTTTRPKDRGVVVQEPS